MAGISIEGQISCVRRELEMRRKVYPGRVRAGTMNRLEARKEIEAMEAVLRTLQGLVQPSVFDQEPQEG